MPRKKSKSQERREEIMKEEEKKEDIIEEMEEKKEPEALPFSEPPEEVKEECAEECKEETEETPKSKEGVAKEDEKVVLLAQKNYLLRDQRFVHEGDTVEVGSLYAETLLTQTNSFTRA